MLSRSVLDLDQSFSDRQLKYSYTRLKGKIIFQEGSLLIFSNDDEANFDWLRGQLFIIIRN